MPFFHQQQRRCKDKHEIKESYSRFVLFCAAAKKNSTKEKENKDMQPPFSSLSKQTHSRTCLDKLRFIDSTRQLVVPLFKTRNHRWSSSASCLIMSFHTPDTRRFQHLLIMKLQCSDHQAALLRANELVLPINVYLGSEKCPLVYYKLWTAPSCIIEMRRTPSKNQGNRMFR